MKQQHYIPIYSTHSIAIVALCGPACRDRIETPYAKVQYLEKQDKKFKPSKTKDITRKF